MIGRRLYGIVPAILFLLLLAGCATAPPPERYFWPPLPDEPKVEHIASYQTLADLYGGQGRERMFKAILGAAKEQVLFKPWGIVSDGMGKVFVTDAALAAVVIFNLDARRIDFIEDVRAPYGIAIDWKGRLLITSGAYRNVLVYSGTGLPLGSFGGGLLKGPAGIAVDGDRHLVYVADVKGHDIKVFDSSGGLLRTVGRRGSGDGEFNFPTDVDVLSDGGLVVADSMNARIQVFDRDGRFIRAFGHRGTGVGGFMMIKGVAVDSEDHIYVTDTMGSHFKIFASNGDLLLVVGGPYAVGSTGMVPGGFNLPMDISIDERDRIFVVDQQNFAVQVFQYLNEEYLERHPVR